MKRLSTLAAAGLLCLCGCVAQPEFRYASPAEAEKALSSINAHLPTPDQRLDAKEAIVSFSFVDAEGRPRTVRYLSARILYAPPTCLYFDVRNAVAAETVAHIGANETEYWMWVSVGDDSKLWWGTWAALRAGQAREIALPPDRLLAALLWQPLPVQLRDGSKPLLIEVTNADGRPGARESRLLYLAGNADRWPFAAREIRFDPDAGFLPHRILDYDESGDVLMDAELGNYRAVSRAADPAPLTPRRYVVRWPQREAEMRLDISELRVRSSEVPCDSPAESWQGPREFLDYFPPTPDVETDAPPAPDEAREPTSPDA